MTKIPKKNKKSGFTIVELLVAMSIFVILITIAVGAFIQALRSERRLTSLMTVSNNASSVLEQMAREIRTGYLFSPQPICGNSISFNTSASGVSSVVSYDLSSVGSRGVIRRNGQNLTADNVNVSKLCFLVSQDSTSLCSPWRVTIAATVDAFPLSAVVASTAIQTTASSRILPRDMPLSEKVTSDFRYCE
jgi:prepilin-type N-terminal cleavage/methylation domain-containing protein